MVIKLNLADAFGAWERGDAPTARNIVRMVLRETPKLAGAHYLQGLLYLGEGQPSKAVQALKNAALYGPDSPALRLAMGRAYALGGAGAQAEEQFRQALALAPGLPAALWSLSDVLMKAGRGEEAEPLLLSLIDARPEDELAWERLGVLRRERGDSAGALAAFTEAAARLPDHPRPLGNLAAALIEAGRADEALPLIEAARTKHSDDTGLARNHALALVRTGRAVAALPLYEALLAQAPAPDLSRDYAQALLSAGRAGEAVALLALVTQDAADNLKTWFLLGEAARAAGDAEAATRAYQQCLTLDPTDSLGASAALALLAGDGSPNQLPTPYLKNLFNDYAARFDHELTGKLQYRGPEVLRTLLGAQSDRQNLRVIDVGCGTGLSGIPFRDLAGTLTGIDLSPAMLVQAKARDLYDRLIEGEAVTALAELPPASADLIVAADVLVYLGDLEPFHREATRVLAPGGLLLASVEAAGDPETPFHLHDGLRYQHGADALRRLLEALGYRIIALTPVTTRLNRGGPVAGLAYLAERPA
ncbi:tetratricopeptide repeat protein [Elstera sp.]|uniref:tetratricopeptide repeat protein n=1 Tax=Elstera sp. TaxID=1916664 RepID=UPI0037C01A27